MGNLFFEHSLEIFRQNSDQYDIVITDHNMQKLTGFQLCKKLLEVRKKIPIILASGYKENITDEMIDSIALDPFFINLLRWKL